MLRVLLRHKRKALLFFSVIACLTVVAVVFFPRKYLSEAKLFVRVGRETAALDPTATTGHVVAIQNSRERDMNSVLEILKSRSIVEKTVDAIGVDTILAKSSKKSAASWILLPLKLLKQSLNDLDPITDRERAILLVKKQIRLFTPKAADVLTVSAKSISPQLSQTLLEHLLEEFFIAHRRASRTEGSHAFLQEQTELLHSQLSQASVALRDAKNLSGLLTIDGQRQVLNGQLASINEQIGETQADLAYSAAKTIALKNSVDSLPATVVTESVSGIGNEATDRMRTQLYTLEIRERELAARYQETHPSLVAVREQRKFAEEIFQQQQQQRTEVTNALPETNQKLETAWMSEKATVAALRSKNKSLTSQQEKLVRELKSLNDHELQIAELQRKVELFAASYKTYARRLEEARIGEALEAGQISSITIVQRPTYSEQPVAPKKLLVLALGLFFATSGSVFVVIAAEYFSNSFATPEQVERQLALPVLVSIPRTSRHQEVDLSWKSSK